MVRDNESLGIAGMIAAFVLIVAIAVAIDWVSAAAEAAAYNRVTGKHVTTWDAVWLDLRIQSEPKE